MPAFLFRRAKKKEFQLKLLERFSTFKRNLILRIWVQIIILSHIHVKIALIITEMKSVSGSTKPALVIIAFTKAAVVSPRESKVD